MQIYKIYVGKYIVYFYLFEMCLPTQLARKER